MTDDTIELTRRKILAGVGALGVAGAGAGMGTSALFTNTERFEGNTLAAGTLDLKVDWEEHYSYPQLYDLGDPTAGLDYGVLRTDPEDDAYVGLPDPENPVVWVHEDDLSQYMDNTSIESFPDPDNDGVQEMRGEEFEYVPCEHGADVAEHFDPSTGRRTQNASTYDEGAEEPVLPLVDLGDVKPGDFGEFTLSFHLCGNPGYVWLQAGNVSEAENGLNDPEAEVDDSPDDPELAEQIQTVWWYDTDGNNVIDESVGAVDVMIAVDTSGSLSGSDVSDLEGAANDLASDLDASADARVGGLSFGGGSIDDFTALADGPVQFSGLSANGNTPMPAALEIAAAELDANGRSDAETFVVMFTDGGPNYVNTTYSAGGYTVGSGYSGGNPNSTVNDSEMNETAGIADTIREDHRILAVGIDDDKKPTGRSGSIPLLSTYLRDEIAGGQSDKFSAADPGTVSDVLEAIIDTIAEPEQVFRRGTLAADLAALDSGAGIPLDADLSTDFAELDDPDADPNRECFQPGVNYFIGFGWWLPEEVGNEVQGDSVSFDLGFYAEQCRNNDGSGMTDA